jgi:lipopolysaccharide/colanic/teichoic acid biosynthesis glycosyltransferase
MSERGLEYLRSRRKRGLDIIGGSALIGLAAVPTIAVAAGSALDTRHANPFFTQERIGKKGLFYAYKFRTLPKSIENEPVVTHGTFDPRASKFGQFLRQAGLDEAPQLINVIKGDMSLVGIRPLLQKDIDKMESADRKLFVDWEAAYHLGRPGLLGPSQIMRHHYRDGLTPDLFVKSMRMDVEYIEHASLRYDLKILARSPMDILRANMGVIDNTGLRTSPEILENIVLEEIERPNVIDLTLEQEGLIL